MGSSTPHTDPTLPAQSDIAALFAAHPSARAQYEQFVADEATALCRARLSQEPDQPDLLYVLGLLAQRRGDTAFALACLLRSVRLAPATPAYMSALAGAYERAGMTAAAVDTYEATRLLSPDDAETCQGLARALGQSGRQLEAIAAYESALALEPTDVRAQCELGDLLQAANRTSEARVHYKRARSLAPDSADVYLSTGRAWLLQKRPARALTMFRRGLKRHPTHAQLHAAAAVAYLRLMRLDDAVRASRAALAYAPFDLGATRNLLFALELLQQRDECANVYAYLAEAFERVGRWHEAMEAYREAIARRPNSLRGCLGLGWCSLQLGNPAGAIEWLAPATDREPESIENHERLACAFAMTGDLVRYWDEATWYARHQSSRRFEQAIWEGAPLRGKRVLIWSDSSAEDTLLLVRFASALEADGARVYLECDPLLAPVLRDTGYLHRVIPQRAALPDFDEHTRLRTIPHVLRVGWDRVTTSAPYLSVASSIIESASHRFDRSGGRRIGLLWASSSSAGTRSRYVPLATFAPLARVGDAHFYSLQQGLDADERFAPPDGLRLEAMVGEGQGLRDIAGWLMHLDLVIAVDSPVAHLAAALGRNVWLLVPPGPDWRWPLEGDATPWYPTMKLFRRSRTEGWSAVVERMARELVEEA